MYHKQAGGLDKSFSDPMTAAKRGAFRVAKNFLIPMVRLQVKATNLSMTLRQKQENP
jgi:hypothetical protein